MPYDTIEGADLVFEIGSKVKSDFNDKKLPLMKSVINTLLNEKQLIINWDDFK